MFPPCPTDPCDLKFQANFKSSVIKWSQVEGAFFNTTGPDGDETLTYLPACPIQRKKTQSNKTSEEITFSWKPSNEISQPERFKEKRASHLSQMDF